MNSEYWQADEGGGPVFVSWGIFQTLQVWV